MKALTLTQPWATLVALEAKRIETRSWPTAYRGPLAIHAAKGFAIGKRACENLCHLEPFRSELMAAGRRSGEARIFSFDMLPLGAIVAVCDLEAVIPTGMMDVRYPPSHAAEHEFEFGDYTPGRFAWVLCNVRALVEPIECRGALGLWDVPADLFPLIESRAREPEAMPAKEGTGSFGV